MNKLTALFGLFRKGAVVTDAAAWKNRQITATVLAGVIVAVVNALAAFGYSLPIDVETANAIAAGIIAVVNTVLTVTTTEKVGFNQLDAEKVGLPSKEEPAQEQPKLETNNEEISNYNF